MPMPDTAAANPRLATISEAASRFGISVRTLERMLSQGQIPHLRFRRSVRLDLDEVRQVVHRPARRLPNRDGR